MKLGEFDLIEEIRRRFDVPQDTLGIGDDCAVLPQHDGKETLVSTDMLVDGVHFLSDDVTALDLGWKSAAVNISDIAGMGGRPVGSFLSFALPGRLDDDWLLKFIEGYKLLSDMFGCPLLGGDTTSSPDRLCISVTVLGESETSKSHKRSDARVGDLVCVTGCLGDSAAGLQIILDEAAGLRRKSERSDLDWALVDSHYRPFPQVEAGLTLSATEGVHAMMDISDGVGSDLRHILKASGVEAEVDVNKLPLSPELKEACSLNEGWDPVHFALDGGEDYQLLFTATAGAVEELRKKGLPVTEIGRITGVSQSLSHRNRCRQS